MHFIIYLFFAVLIFSACEKQKGITEVKSGGQTMGTTYNITYLDSTGRDWSASLDSLLIEFNRVFSTYDSTSVISQFNMSDTGIALTGNNLAWFTRIMLAADSVYRYTQGAFNPSIAPLVQYWGFYGKEKSLEIKPDQQIIDSLIILSDWSNISQENQFLKKKNIHARLDVNAFAPGFACDLLGEFLEEHAITNYMIEIGGEIRCRGVNAKGNAWAVGIMQPEELSKQIISTVNLHNLSLATSGNYNKYVMVDGKRLGHTIDPKTGFPSVNNLLSATIVTEDAMFADAFATACMVMGFEKAKNFIEREESLQAYFIYTDVSNTMQTWYSSGLTNLIKEKKN